MDGQTAIAALRKQVSKFRDERGWLKDNTPKNLAISITVEAAELFEHFQWKTDEQIREAVHRARGRAKIEISGGVTLERIPELATTGADYVSVGALTHSAPAVDISFELEPL